MVRAFPEVVWGPRWIEWARTWGGAASEVGAAIGGGARSPRGRRVSDEVDVGGGYRRSSFGLKMLKGILEKEVNGDGGDWS